MVGQLIPRALTLPAQGATGYTPPPTHTEPAGAIPAQQRAHKQRAAGGAIPETAPPLGPPKTEVVQQMAVASDDSDDGDTGTGAAHLHFDCGFHAITPNKEMCRLLIKTSFFF